LSLNFPFFTAVVLAFGWADVHEPLTNASAVLTSVARLRSRLRVFVSGGSLHPLATTKRRLAPKRGGPEARIRSASRVAGVEERAGIKLAEITGLCRGAWKKLED